MTHFAHFHFPGLGKMTYIYKITLGSVPKILGKKVWSFAKQGGGVSGGCTKIILLFFKVFFRGVWQKTILSPNFFQNPSLICTKKVILNKKS